MSTISTVSVNFVANVANFTTGLAKMAGSSKAFSAGLKKDSANAAKDLLEIGKAAGAAGAVLYTAIAAGIAKSILEISKLKDEADKVGASASGFMKLSAVAAQSGATMEDVKRGMVEITKSLNDVTKGSTETYQAFRQLNVDWTKLKDLSADKQFEAVASALSQISDKTERARLGTIILGKAYVELANVVGGINDIKLPIGSTLSDQDIKNIKAAGEAFDELKDSISGAFNILAAGFAPILTEAFKIASNAIKDFIGNSSNLIDVLSLLATPVIVLVQLFDGVAFVLKTVAIVLKTGELAILQLQHAFSFAFQVMGGTVLSFTGLFIDLINVVGKLKDKLSGKPETDLISTQFITDGIKNLEQSVDIFKDAKNKAAAELKELVFGQTESYSDKLTKALSSGIAGAVKAAGEVSSKQINTAADNFKKVLFDAVGKIYGSQYTFGGGKQVLTGVNGLLKDDLTTRSYKEKATEFQRIQDLGIGLRDSTQTSSEAAQKKIDDIKKASEMTDEYGKSLLTVEQQTRALADAQLELWTANNPLLREAGNAMNDFASGMANAIFSGGSLGDVFNNLLKQILVMIVKMAILQSIMATIGFVNPAAAKAFGALAGVPVAGKARGGNVSAGQLYRVGESGAESFIPSTDGVIIPHDMSLGGGGTTVVQNIQIQTGTAQTVRNEMYSLMPQFRAQAMLGVVDGRARGGSYARAITA